MKIKKLNPNAVVPTRGSDNSAGYDLYACLDAAAVVIPPHTTYLVDTGWAMQIPWGHFGAIFARSGLASKHGLRPANCVGVIDSDYRGPVKVALHNDTDKAQTIENGDRVAQLIVMEYNYIDFEVVEDLDDSERGADGFGSTGR